MDFVSLLPFLMFVVLLGLLMWGFPVAYTLAGTAVLFGALGWILPNVDFHISDCADDLI